MATRAVFLTEADTTVASSPGLGKRRASVRQATSTGGAADDGPITFAKIRLRNAVKKITKLQTSTSKFEFPTLDTVRMPKLRRLDDATTSGRSPAALEGQRLPTARTSNNNQGGDGAVDDGPLAHSQEALDSTPALGSEVPGVPTVLSARALASSPTVHRHRMFEYVNPVYPAQTPVSDVVEAVLDKQPVQVLDRLTKRVIDWWTGPDARDLLLDIFWITVGGLRQQPMPIPDFEFAFHHHLAVTFGETFSKLTETVLYGALSADGNGTRETIFDLFSSLACQITYFALTHVFPHDVEKAVFSSNFCRSLYQRVHFWTTGVVPQVANTRHWQPSPRHAKALARSGTNVAVDKQAEAQRNRLKHKTTFHRAMLTRSSSRTSFSREVSDAIRPAEAELGDDIAKALNRSKNKNSTGDFVPIRHSGAGRWYEQGFPRGFLSTQRVDEYEMSGARIIDLTFPLMPEVNPLMMVGGAKGDEDRDVLPKIRAPGKAANRTATAARSEALHNASSTAVVEHATNAARRGSFASSIAATLNATSEAHAYASPEFVEASRLLQRGLDTHLPDDVKVTTDVIRTAAASDVAKMQQSLHAVGHSEIDRRMDVDFVLSERQRRRGVLPSHAPLMLYYMQKVLGIEDIHHPVGRPVPFTKLSELDRTTKGARFTTYALESIKTAEHVLKANEDTIEAGRRREQRNKEMLAEQEKKWRTKIKYAAQLLSVKASPRNEEHAVVAAEAAKQLREALFERGKDIHTIIDRYDAALERAKVMFSLPYALRKLLWDLGLQCKLRLLFWQRSAPHKFMTVNHQLDEAGVAQLNDLVDRITTRRVDLAGQLSRTWEEKSIVHGSEAEEQEQDEGEPTLWGMRAEEVLGGTNQAYGHAELQIASARSTARSQESRSPGTNVTPAVHEDKPWSYAGMVAELERRRAEEQEAAAFSSRVDGFITNAMRCEDPSSDNDRSDDGMATVVGTTMEKSQRPSVSLTTAYAKLSDEDLLKAMHRTRRTDEEEARRIARRRSVLEHITDPECDPAFAQGLAMRHGAAVVGANNLIGHVAGVVQNSNEAPKQHYEEVDNDHVSKYLESKLMIALGTKKKEKPQWQRTWIVKEGEELTTQPPLVDPSTIAISKAEVIARRANMPNAVSQRIKRTPRALGAASPTLDATTTQIEAPESPSFLSASTETPGSPVASFTARAPQLPLLPTARPAFPPSAIGTRTAVHVDESQMQASGAVVAPEVVEMIDTHSARRFEMATPPTTIAPAASQFRSRVGASMRSGAHTIFNASTRVPSMPLSARAPAPASTSLPPLPATARRP